MDRNKLFGAWLMALNAKERQHLSEWIYWGPQATALAQANGGLPNGIHQGLQDLITRCTGSAAKATILFQSMDYHFDWVFAALTLTRDVVLPASIADQKTLTSRVAKTFADGLLKLEEGHKQPDGLTPEAHRHALLKKYTKFCTPNFTGQDADWLIYLEQEGRHHLLFLECKFENHWDYPQIAGKLFRLRQLEALAGDLRVKMCLVSPEQNQASSAIKKAVMKHINDFHDHMDLPRPQEDDYFRLLTDDQKGFPLWEPLPKPSHHFQVSRSRQGQDLDAFGKTRLGNAWAIYRR